MKKTKKLLTIIASLMIVAVSFPLINSTNRVEAQGLTCGNFTDNFSTAAQDSFWFGAFGTKEISGGVLTVTSTDIGGAQYGAATFNYPASGGMYDPKPLVGSWVLNIDLANLINLTNDVDGYSAYGGFDLFFEGTNNEVSSAYGLYVQDFEDGNDAKIFSNYLINGVIETKGSLAIHEYLDGDTITLNVSKVGNNVEMAYIVGDVRTIVATYTDVVGDPYFRITNYGVSTDNAEVIMSVDNISVICVGGGSGPDLEVPMLANVARFFNIRIGSAHFYSIDPVETQFVYDNSLPGGLWPGVFELEEPTFAAYTYPDETAPCINGAKPVKRYLNTSTGDTHFYAIDPAEINAVETTYADTFDSEGVAFCAYDTQVEGTIPVYRWQNTILGSTHFYSAKQSEIDYVNNELQSIFKPEGIAFYAMPTN